MMRVVHNRLGDANSGAGYGTTKTKSSGQSYPAPSTYPYDVVDNQHVDEEDPELADAILKKTGMSSTARAPAQWRNDRSSLTKVRLDLFESYLHEIDIKQGISPFPFSTLYKKFDGPAAGGSTTNFAYRTGPGKMLNATTRGWSQAQDFDPIGDKIRINDIFDTIDPDKRSLLKANLMIKMSQKDDK